MNMLSPERRKHLQEEHSLHNYHFEALDGIQPVDKAAQKKLERMRPGYRRFDAYGMHILARKSTKIHY